MSELSKVSSTVESLKASVANIALIDPNIEHKTTITRLAYNDMKKTCDSLEKYKDQISNDIQPILTKLMIKKDTKDPISGVARFGQSAVNKIIHLNEQVITLETQCDNLFNAYSSLINKYASMFMDEVDTSSSLVNSNIPPAAANYQIDLQYLVGNSITDDTPDLSSSSFVGLEDEEKRKFQQQQQHTHADELRKKRQFEIQETYTQIHHRTKHLRKEIASLNAKTRGILALPLVFTILKDNWNPAPLSPVTLVTSSSSSSSTSTIHGLLQSVIKILDQIIQYPDKDELRRLRIDHPLLWNTITSHTGGLLLLLALGFELKTESHAPLSSFNLDASSSSSSSSAGNPIGNISDASYISNNSNYCSSSNNYSSISSSSSNSYSSSSSGGTCLVPEAYQLINLCNDIAMLSVVLSSSLGSNSNTDDDVKKNYTLPTTVTSTSPTMIISDIGSMRLRLIMHMNEPSVDDMSGWVKWFDGLSGMKQYLETELSLLP